MAEAQHSAEERQRSNPRPASHRLLANGGGGVRHYLHYSTVRQPDICSNSSRKRSWASRFSRRHSSSASNRRCASASRTIFTTRSILLQVVASVHLRPASESSSARSREACSSVRHRAQYSLSIDTFGRVQCGVTHDGTRPTRGWRRPTGTNGISSRARTTARTCAAMRFPNGSASPATTCNAYTQSLDTNVGYGTTIGECAIPTYGSQFVGSLDQVRIYARTLSRRIAPQRPAESAQCFYLLSFLVAVVRASDAAKRNDRVWM